MLGAVACAGIAARLLRPRHQATAPAEIDLRTYFDDEEIARASRYARPQQALALAGGAIQLSALVAAILRAPREPLARSSRPVTAGALTGAGLAVGLTLLELPLGAIARRRAMTVGLVTQSWRGWGTDLIKSTAIGAGLAGAAGGAVVVVTRRYPRAWWVPAAAGSTLVGVVFTTLAPLVLDPVFNDFTPLPEGETRTDVLELASAADVQVGEVYSVDASRRTTAANAYVTGLGPSKRVVLFDTLLDRYSRDEVRVVVAHELAHVRNRDVLRSVLYGAIVAPAAALAVQRLSWTLSRERGTPAALPALALAVGIVGVPTGLIANRLSRVVERRADEYSLELSDSPEAFISFERAISLQNLADLDPPRWITSLLATHPPTIERIGAALAYRRRQTSQSDVESRYS